MLSRWEFGAAQKQAWRVGVNCQTYEGLTEDEERSGISEYVSFCFYLCLHIALVFGDFYLKKKKKSILIITSRHMSNRLYTHVAATANEEKVAKRGHFKNSLGFGLSTLLLTCCATSLTVSCGHFFGSY